MSIWNVLILDSPTCWSNIPKDLNKKTHGYVNQQFSNVHFLQLNLHKLHHISSPYLGVRWFFCWIQNLIIINQGKAVKVSTLRRFRLFEKKNRLLKTGRAGDVPLGVAKLELLGLGGHYFFHLQIFVHLSNRCVFCRNAFFFSNKHHLEYTKQHIIRLQLDYSRCYLSWAQFPDVPSKSKILGVGAAIAISFDTSWGKTVVYTCFTTNRTINW